LRLHDVRPRADMRSIRINHRIFRGEGNSEEQQQCNHLNQNLNFDCSNFQSRMRTALAVAPGCLWLLVASPIVSAATQSERPPSLEPIEPDQPDVTDRTRIVGPGFLLLEFGGLDTRHYASSKSGDRSPT